ncbi:MAG: hypothetical protein A2W25_14670 [candidate division Zixibacteria bacterium RBG_16_53_22]|nr:MAG: hypothetical protein A2W25_14670 [candidate division Zixibacteria bacterium RBG_16_53_22]
MIKTLQLLNAAIGNSSDQSIFRCFHIYAGRIQAQNGRITIDSHCSFAGDFTVDAERFGKAVIACEGAPVLKFTDGGKLSLKKGAFRAMLPLMEHAAFPRVEKDAAKIVPLSAPILPLLEKLLPLCAENDSRIWMNGIQIKEGYAYATDGLIIARAPIALTCDHAINIPAETIAALVKIGIEPDGVVIAENWVLFDFGEAWMRTQLLDAAWPDVPSQILGVDPGAPIPEGLAENIKKILPFCVDKKFEHVIFSAAGISTAEGEAFAQVGGITLPDGRYAADVLLRALAIATHANFAAYPQGVGFKGADGIEGVFMGLRE